MQQLSKAAILEIHDLTSEARRLAGGSQTDRKTADVILARVANIRASGLSTHEMRSQYTDALVEKINGSAAQRRAQHEAAFRRLVLARNDIGVRAAEQEFRDMEAGTQSISYTQGPGGGYLVPVVFYNDVITGMAQTDPLLSENNVNLIKEPGFATPAKTLAGYDLSSISASRVGENSNPGPGSFPTVSGQQLQGYIYRLALQGSFEIEADDFESVSTTMSRAYGVGFARGIGIDLVTGLGAGSSQPQGLSTAAANCGVTTGAAGVITADDINAIFFSVNRIYRNSPKCAWVMADSTYELIRKAKDSQNRPLLDMQDDLETLMGKRVLVSPSMPSGAGSKGIIFGDLSHFNVRLSAMWFRRSFQLVGLAENYRALYIGLMRADSYLLDPAAASSPVVGTPPVIYATLHS